MASAPRIKRVTAREQNRAYSHVYDRVRDQAEKPGGWVDGVEVYLRGYYAER